MARTVCGHWIFAWNAFRIECDPQSVIKTVQSFDLRSVDLRDGAPYRETEALGSAKLARKPSESGAIFAVEMSVDPDAVRRARAESDVAVWEIMNKPVSLDAALRERAKEAVSDTISVAFETDPAGNVRRRTKVTKLDIAGPDGRSETETVTETLERDSFHDATDWPRTCYECLPVFPRSAEKLQLHAGDRFAVATGEERASLLRVPAAVKLIGWGGFAGVSCALLCFVVLTCNGRPWQVVELTDQPEPRTGLIMPGSRVRVPPFPFNQLLEIGPQNADSP